MRHFLQALRTKDRAIILKYLRLQGELTALKILYYFLYGVLAIVIGIPIGLLFLTITVVFVVFFAVFFAVVFLVATIVFFLVAMVARLFGKDIVGWLQERMKLKQSNEDNKC